MGFKIILSSYTYPSLSNLSTPLPSPSPIDGEGMCWESIGRCRKVVNGCLYFDTNLLNQCEDVNKNLSRQISGLLVRVKVRKPVSLYVKG